MQTFTKMLLAGCLALPLAASMPMQAQRAPLGGFYYGEMAAPTGWEWQSPDSVAYNKLQPHAWFFSFGTVENARKVLPEHSEYWQTLDGEWQFHWASNPELRPKDFYKTDFNTSNWDKVQVPMCWNLAGQQSDGTLKYGKPLYSNQRVIFQHSVKVGDWKGGVMRTPPKDWQSYTDRNEVGSYRRTFTVPESWNGRQVVVNFDGVDSFFYLYINGHYVGFSKNSRNAARFDITPYLVKGENVIAVEVYRHSDGSFLESQDMWRLPGIFRSVALTSKPKVQVTDVVAIPEYKMAERKGALNISAQIKNLSGKKVKGYTIDYTLYANELYSDENKLVEGVKATAQVSEMGKIGEVEAKVKLEAPGVRGWNAEKPYRYTLVGQLKDKKGRVVETFSTVVGFREIVIRETPASEDEFGLAGRYYYLNDRPIKMKGVNRHENNPNTGHAISRKQMEEEVMLMKRGNINHVRNSHYPDDPYWYYLCDKYGIYLEDEANIESHQYYYGKESTSHVPEFLNQHIARNMEMVHSTINSPSVCIWSLGNEAGPGVNFEKAYAAIKAFDTSRPVQYERNNGIVDMGSNQYPSIAWTEGAVTGKYNLVYPFHISEYAHSMGNACGNLIDYWNAIESTNFFIGGAIWDWVDQAQYKIDPKSGKRYFAYGGDFSFDNKPNDGMFCMNGIMCPDLEPKAQYYEVKKVYQNVGVKAVDMKQGNIEIFNKNYFEPLNDYEIVWSLWKDGVCVEKNKPLQGPRMVLGPRMKQHYRLPYDYSKLEAGSEYFVKVEFLQNADRPWAKKGYSQMSEQLLVKTSAAKPALSEVAKADGKIQVEKSADGIRVKGTNFNVEFSTATGALSALTYGNRSIVNPGKGLQLDAFRAPVDNDNWAFGKWFQVGLHNLQHKATSSKVVEMKDGTVQVMFTVESQAPHAYRNNYSDRDRVPTTVYDPIALKDKPYGPKDFKFVTNTVYTIYPDGSIESQNAIKSNMASVVLPRLGFAMQLPSDLSKYYYYGRGPVNNYNDRKTGQYVELHASTPAEQGIMLPKPQSQGNREDVRWCALTDASGRGALFIADSTMSASALPWSQQELMGAAHPFQLPKSSGTTLHLDAKVTGLGGNSCGQGGPLSPDRVTAGARTFSFAIRPLNIGRAMPTVIQEQANVSLHSLTPISVSCSLDGKVTMQGANADEVILYTINGAKKASTYDGKFIDLSAGGVLKAWYKSNPNISIEEKFEKVESVPLQVVYASSVETDEGPAENLVDGNPDTFWHTMYSVTLAKYPHWIDFDASSVKTMRGFVFTPRQGSANGRIKDYEIYVSQDGKNWGKPIHKASFANNEQAKRVMFSSPVKARYIRLQGLNEHGGCDYATGAEFMLIAD